MTGTHDGPAVALVGFMGAGKSAVGRELGVALGVPFVDTDDLVVAQAGPIDTLFSERGEAAFRTIEAAVVTAAVADALVRPCVLALGGGAVLRGTCVRPSRASRTSSGSRRPSRCCGRAPLPPARPYGRSPLDERAFRELFAAREPLYRAVATQVVDGAVRPAAAIAAALVAGWSRAGEVAAGDGAR